MGSITVIADKDFWFVIHAEQAPTNLMVRQIGIDRVRISWIPPPNPPSRGYLIRTDDTRPTDFSVGLTVLLWSI